MSHFSQNSDDSGKLQLFIDPQTKTLLRRSLEETYEIAKIVSWIRHLNPTKVALQFSDQLLGDGPSVALKLKEICKIQLFILADMSHGSCCVDEASAERVNADAVIHFGKACLSHKPQLSTMFVLGNGLVEWAPFFDNFKETFTQKDQVVLASDFKYHQSMESILSGLSSHSYRVKYLEPNIGSNTGNHLEAKGERFVISGRNCVIDYPKQTLQNWNVLYIGEDEEDSSINSLMLTLNCSPFYIYNPSRSNLKKVSLDMNQKLRQRYYLVERAKEAQLIGILVATAVGKGGTDCLEIVERMKRLIVNAGKKFYTFVVGKLNPSKLANFPEIDCYVIVACPDRSLLESREFYRPVITPFELEVALNRARPWSGDYINDFRLLLPGATGHVELDPGSEPEGLTDVSLVSGRLRTLTVEPEEVHTDGKCDDSVAKGRKQNRDINTLPSGTDFFRLQRDWNGLVPRVGESSIPSSANLGKRGIASSYHEETVFMP